MSTRQYVGARYVPIVMGEWNNTVAYEALSIVTYLGNSYTSKKPVPVGTEITNTEYWVLTGNYNAQVEEYRQEVEEAVGEVETAIAAIGTDYMKSIKNRKFLIVGDSYADGQQGGSPAQEFPYYLKIYLGLTDNEVFVVARGGDGFNCPVGDKFIEQIQGWTGDKESITDIVVAGGLNDSPYGNNAANITALENAISDFATYAKNNYPNATLWLAYIGNGTHESTVGANKNLNLRKTVSNVYNDFGPRVGFKVIGDAMLVLSGNINLLYSDGFHPSVDGHRQIATMLATSLTYGKWYKTSRYNSLSMTCSGVFNPASTITFHKYINGSVTEFADIIVTNMPCTEDMQANSNIEIATLSSDYFNESVQVPVDIRFTYYDNIHFDKVQGYLIFNTDKVYLRFTEINSSGENVTTKHSTNDASAISINRGGETIKFEFPTYILA